MNAISLTRYGYNCVIYGWDPACMMGHEWIRNMNVHSLPHGPHQPFYNVLVEDGSCRYAAQGEQGLLWAPSAHTRMKGSLIDQLSLVNKGYKGGNYLSCGLLCLLPMKSAVLGWT